METHKEYPVPPTSGGWDSDFYSITTTGGAPMAEECDDFPDNEGDE